MKTTKLLAAIRRCDLPEVERLVAAGARVEGRWWEALFSRGSAALHAAISMRSLPIVEYLLEHGADPIGNAREFPPLQHACVDGEIAIVELLVARGAYIDGWPGSKIPSPIGVAVSRRDMRLIDWLLAHGADPSTGFAQQVAIHRASHAVLARLLDAGATAPPDVERAIRAGRW